ncbi:unnamed protein product [Rotaria sordida]|uniref:Uncharacterized protein n=1 Tax=Rotaria sordida TaxID=392033 RepID=A0A816B292_9BILA|nr:unnamed protein product [Rotaria sordida]CAF1605731.1 unnamed protein product [Rotaria sordida]
MFVMFVLIRRFHHVNILYLTVATVSIKKQVFTIYVPVPCVFTRSCTLDDICTSCKQCNCPYGKREYTKNVSMKIKPISSILAGNCQAQIDIETNLRGKCCVIINNISIKANK